jgi:hypothetical protein
MTLRTRCGRRVARPSAIEAPNEVPPMCAGARSSASIRARRSSSSRLVPWPPRLAVAVLATVVGDYEKDRAKPGTTGCQLRWSDQLPWTSTSGSPRPVSS